MKKNVIDFYDKIVAKIDCKVAKIVRNDCKL